jgi:hypothetical protein
MKLSAKRVQWGLAFLTALVGAGVVYAQNPVSISQVGTTPVTTTVPVSGTVTASQGTAANLNATVVGTGTFATQSAITAASSAIADGAMVTVGSKADAKSTATDTTSVSIMSVLKQISASVQAPPSQAVTNAGTFAVQAAEADGANVTLGAKADAKSTATDTTAVSAMSVLKQISASVQAPPSQAVTNAGTFATQSAITAASGSIASGAIASGAVASGAFASGSIGSGAIASGAIASGAVASGAYGSDSGSFGVGSTGSAPPAKASFIAGIVSGATGGLLGGVPVCDTVKVVSVTSATTTALVTGVSGRHVRICAIHLVTAIANNVALVSGTGATCGTGTAGIAGGSTAANGWNFAANGGLAFGSGIGTVAQTAATGDSVCVITSAAGPLAGTLSYTIY